MMTKKEWADREALCYRAFLDELIIMDGHPQNEGLARQIIETLQKKYNLINF